MSNINKIINNKSTYLGVKTGISPLDSFKNEEYVDTKNEEKKEEKQKILSLELNKINVYSNVRTEINDIDDLAQSIKEVGLLQPIGVFLSEGKYYILEGHRRFLAVKKLGWEKIDVIIHEKPKNDFLLKEIQIIENVQKDSLSDYDLEMALRDLYLHYDKNVEIVAQKIGKSTSYVYKYLKINQYRERNNIPSEAKSSEVYEKMRQKTKDNKEKRAENNAGDKRRLSYLYDEEEKAVIFKFYCEKDEYEVFVKKILDFLKRKEAK